MIAEKAFTGKLSVSGPIPNPEISPSEK